MSKSDWVVGGGAPGESGYCQRCGEGLTIKMPVRVEVWTAAMKAFVKAHSKCKDMGRVETVVSLERWPSSRDTGVSSGTIFHWFTGRQIYRERDIPHDPSDFGRCCRLLKLAPQWEARLQEVADAYPAWVPFVRAWPRLTAMWEEALKTDNGKPMYDFMRTLHAEER